ncbi:MAG: type II toxin-antitoxin system Phd/YefM family antitoxin [Schwartzia sp.]|nr:type II toxin-antitoxin system Phd/YefM family antitoxin [Schwartzia sp. (in: firmicutes)]
MPQMRTILELQDTDAIATLCHARKEPVFITKDGESDLVIMSVETYDTMFREAEIDRDIAEAEAEYQRDGVLLDAREALIGLRGKYFG